MRSCETLEPWRLFSRTVELGNFSRVAHEMGVQPSSVSRAVSDLEKELSWPLLERNVHGITPTWIGESAYERIRPLIEEIDAAQRAIFAAAHSQEGLVRIAVPSYGNTELFSPWLSDFRREHPGIVVEEQIVYTGNPSEAAIASADLWIAIGHEPQGRVIATALGSIPLVIAASPAYLAHHGVPKTPQELLTHRLQQASSLVGPMVNLTLGGTERFTLNVQQTHSIASQETVLKVALQGNAVLVGAMAKSVDPALRSGRLVQILPNWTMDPVPVWILRRPTSMADPAQKLLIEWMRQRWLQANGLLTPGSGQAPEASRLP